MGWYTLGLIDKASDQLPSLYLRSYKAVHKPSQALFTEFKTNLAAIAHSAVAVLVVNTYEVVVLRLVTALVTDDINHGSSLFFVLILWQFAQIKSHFSISARMSINFLL